MLLGEYFKSKRLAKGLTEAEVAKVIGPDFEASLLWDFESGDDNDMDGMSLQEFKRYCVVLGVLPTDFADIPISNISHLPLHLLVKARREEKRLSIEDLAGHIGYEPSVLQAIEEQLDDITVVLDALREVAMALDIPFRLLLEKI